MPSTQVWHWTGAVLLLTVACVHATDMQYTYDADWYESSSDDEADLAKTQDSSNAELEWDSYDVSWTQDSSLEPVAERTRLRREATVRTLQVSNIRINVTLAASQTVSVSGTDSITRSVRLNPVPPSIKLPNYALVFNESSEAVADTTRIQIDLAKSGLVSTASYTNESVSIVFSTLQPDGLMWAYAEPSGYKSAIFLKGGKLCIASIDMQVNGRVTKVEKAIAGDQFTNGFASGLPVLVRITTTRPVVTGSRVQVDIGDQSVLTYTFKSGLRLLGSGNVYIGAAPSNLVTELTFGEITDRFVGYLYVVSAQRDLRLIDVSYELRFRAATATYISESGPNAYWIMINNLGQNASRDDHETPNVFDLSSPNPATFYGQSAAYRIVPRSVTDWSYFDLDLPVGSQSILEFGVLSFDERGVLLYKGALLGTRTYFCIELFDGYLYLVYNLMVGYDRSARHQICPFRVADRIRKTQKLRRGAAPVYQAVNVTMRSRRELSDLVIFSVQCENQPVYEIRLANYSETQKFAGYLYVGGLDSESRLPWYVWSRVFFNGAVTFLRINGKFVAYDAYFGQHSVPGALLGRIDVIDYCAARQLCAQSETGICRVDRPRIPGRSNMTCDCAHLNRTALTCNPNPLTFKYDNTFYELVITPLWNTHVDDITISFKSTQQFDVLPPAGLTNITGGVLFRVMGEVNWNDLQRIKYFEVRLLNGELWLALLVNNIAAKQDGTRVRLNLFDDTAVRLNDGAWHTFRYARRGDLAMFSIDGRNVRNVTLRGSGFQMVTKFIGVGCATTGEFSCEANSYFVGQIRNFVYNRLDVLRTLDVVMSSGAKQELALGSDDISINVAVHTIDIDRTGMPDASAGAGSGGSRTNATLTNLVGTLGNTISLVGHSSSLLEIPLRSYVTLAENGNVELNSFSFAFRTTLPNCLLSYQRPAPATVADYRTVTDQFVKFELVNGILRFAMRFRPLEADAIAQNAEQNEDANDQEPARRRVRRAVEGEYLVFSYDFNDIGSLSDSQDHLVSYFISTIRVTVNVDRREEFSDDLLSSGQILSSLPPTLFYAAVLFFGGLPTADMWLAAERAGHIAQQYVEPSSLQPGARLSVRQSAYFRGCIIGLSVHGRLLDFDSLSQVHGDVGRDWVLKKGCSDDMVLRCTPDLQCSNEGRCVQDTTSVHARCECLGTGYSGLRCRMQPRGFYVSPNGAYGGVQFGFTEPPDVDVIVQGKPQSADVLVFGLLAAYVNGTFLRIESPGYNQTLTLSLIPDCWQAASSDEAAAQCACGMLIEYAGAFVDRPVSVALGAAQLGASLCDGRYHVWRLIVADNNLFVSHVDNHSAPSGSSTARLNIGPLTTMPNLGRFFSSASYRVLVGTDRMPNATRPFTGIIGGLAWNKVDVFGSEGITWSGDVRPVEHPYRLVDVPCPSLFRSLSTCPDAIPGDRDRTLSTSRPTYATLPAGLLYGRGGNVDSFDWQQAAIIDTLALGNAQDASRVAAFAIIAGILMFISALIWAFCKCKPGACCPAAAGGAAATQTVAETVPFVSMSSSTGTQVATATDSQVEGGDIPTRLGSTLRAAPPTKSVAAAAEEDIVVAHKVDKQRSAPPTAPALADADDLLEEQFVSTQRAGVNMAGSQFDNDITVSGSRGGFAASPLNAANGFRTTASAMHLGADRLAANRYQTSASSDMLGAQRGFTTQSSFQSSYQLDERAARRGMVQDANGGAFSVPDDAKVSCFALAGSSQFVVTGSSCGAPSLWDLKNGDLVRTLEGDESLTSAYGLHLACGDRVLIGEICTMSDDTALNMRRLQMWDTLTGRAIEMPLIVYCNAACMLHNDGEIACAAIEPGSNAQLNLLAWDVNRNDVARQFAYPLGGVLLQCGIQPEVNGRWNVQLFTAPFDDSALLVAIEPRTESPLGVLRSEPTVLVSVDRAMLAGTSHDEPSTTAVDCTADCVVLTPFGTTIVGSRRGELLVLATRTLALVGAVNCSSTARGSTLRGGQANAVTCLSASADRRLLASGHGSSISSPFTAPSVDNIDRPATDWHAVRVWQLDSGSHTPVCQHVLIGHSDDIASVAFSRDGDCLVSGSRDGSIRMWRVRDGSQMCWFASNIAVMRVQVAFNQQAIIALGEQLAQRKLIMLQIVRSRVKRTQPIRA